MVARTVLTGILMFGAILGSSTVMATPSDATPIEIGLFPPLQLPNTGYGVKGIRLTALGVNRTVTGLDLGILGNVTDVEFHGTAISGLFNFNRGNSTVYGLQLAGLANINKGNSTVYGVQIAAYNLAGSVYGLQIGLVNVANDLHGVQIGIFNINHKGPFHGSPLINVGF